MTSLPVCLRMFSRRDLLHAGPPTQAAIKPNDKLQKVKSEMKYLKSRQYTLDFLSDKIFLLPREFLCSSTSLVSSFVVFNYLNKILELG